MLHTKRNYLAMLVATGLMVACSDTTTQQTTAPTSAVASAVASEPVELTINVGIDANYPPYDYRDEQGQATGFDVEILKAIAKNQKIGLTIIPERWDTLVEDFDNKKFGWCPEKCAVLNLFRIIDCPKSNVK